MAETRMSKLGDRLDGWADLADGAGDCAEQARAHFQEIMSARQIPDVEVDKRDMRTGGLMGKQRPYHISFHRAGVTLAVYIGAAGKDLYVTWDAFLKPVWNQMVIFGILGAAAILGIMGANASDPWTGTSSFSFMVWILLAIGWTIGLSLLTLAAGKILKNNAMAFFMQQIDEFVADDITAMMFAVHHSLLQSLDMIGVDKTLLRMKEQFRAGRRDRMI